MTYYVYRYMWLIENLNDFVTMRIALEAGTIDGYIAEEPTALTICK